MDVDDEATSQPKNATTRKRKKPAALISSDEEEDEETKRSPPKKKPAVAAASSSKPSSTTKAKPRGSVSTKSKAPPRKVKNNEDYEVSSEEDQDEDDYVDDEVDDLIPKKGVTSKSRAPAKKVGTKRDNEKEKPNVKGKDVKDSVPDAPAKSFKCVLRLTHLLLTFLNQAIIGYYSWAAAKAAKLAGPVAPGSKEVPEPASPDCLAGLAFVFTGELSSFSRDEAADLAKRFGG